MRRDMRQWGRSFIRREGPREAAAMRRLLQRWRTWRYARRVQRALRFAQATPAQDRLRAFQLDAADIALHFGRRTG